MRILLLVFYYILKVFFTKLIATHDGDTIPKLIFSSFEDEILSVEKQ